MRNEFKLEYQQFSVKTCKFDSSAIFRNESAKEQPHYQKALRTSCLSVRLLYQRSLEIWERPKAASQAHTSRFFVVDLQIFCEDQIGLKFVRASACRTVADFQSRLSAFRLGAESIEVFLRASQRGLLFSAEFLFIEIGLILFWSSAHQPTRPDKTF